MNKPWNLVISGNPIFLIEFDPYQYMEELLGVLASVRDRIAEDDHHRPEKCVRSAGILERSDFWKIWKYHFGSRLQNYAHSIYLSRLGTIFISNDQDGPHTLLVRVRYPSGWMRGYRLGQGGLAVLASANQQANLRAIFKKLKYIDKQGRMKQMARNMKRRQQSSDVGNVNITVFMTGQHFKEGIPSNFAETIARNLAATKLDGSFKATIKDVCCRNIGQGRIRVKRILPIGNRLEISVEPNIPDSNKNRFDCVLQCPPEHSSKDVFDLINRLNGNMLKSAITTETASEAVTAEEKSLEVAEETAPPETKETAAPVPVGFAYPDLNEARYHNELCEILKRIGENEISITDLTNLVMEVCDLAERPRNAIGRYVVGRIAVDKDGPEAILLKLRRSWDQVYAYRLGELGLGLIGKPCPTAVEEVASGPEITQPVISEPATPEPPAPAAPSDAVADVTALVETIKSNADDGWDLDVIDRFLSAYESLLADVKSNRRRERISAAFNRGFKAILDDEIRFCREQVTATEKAQQTLDQIRSLLRDIQP